MSKLELQAALTKLDVKTPIKLKQPVFSPPKWRNLGAKTDPGSKVAPGSKMDPGYETGPGSLIAPRSESYLGSEIDPRYFLDPGSDGTPRAERVIKQHGSVLWDSRAGQCEGGLATGYTRLPNRLLMMIVGGDLSRTEIKIALLVARYTISFQRQFTPISKSVIERRCGLKGSVVLEALNSLVTKGIVLKKAGDAQGPNWLGLAWGPDDDSRQRDLGAKTDPGSNIDLGSKNGETLGLFLAEPRPQNGPPFKDIYKNIKIPSPQVLPTQQIQDRQLAEYFAQLRPEKKRTTELESFWGLRKEFSEEQIARGLAFIQEHGVLFSQEPCHSPMKYLGTAMEQVLAQVSRLVDQEEARKGQEEQRRQQEQIAQAKAAQEAIDRQKREQAFLAAFPELTQQEAVVHAFAAKSGLLDPASPVTRALAIRDWWSEKEEKGA